VRSLEDNLFHVASDDLVGGCTEFEVDEVQEFLDIAQQLVADALAGGVDGTLYIGGGKDHGGCKHADADGFAKPASLG